MNLFQFPETYIRFISAIRYNINIKNVWEIRCNIFYVITYNTLKSLSSDCLVVSSAAEYPLLPERWQILQR